MKKYLLIVILPFILFSCQQESKTVFIDELDLSKMETGWGQNQINKSIDKNPLSIAGQAYKRGIGTHAISKMMIDLGGTARSFSAKAGVDDESGERASVEFFVFGDGKALWKSGLMKVGDEAKEVNVNLKGIQKMALYVSDGGDFIHYDHADWINAKIEYAGETPSAILSKTQETYLLTPTIQESPQINYPRIYGASPNKPFLFRLPVSGERPMRFSAGNLPKGLTLDKNSGVISGKVRKLGIYVVEITAKNAKGSDQQRVTFSIGNGLALTPPMGWNSWNCWGLSVTQEQVKAAGDAFISSGLADHGWAYINIDDGWEAAERTNSGELLPNEKFPDMKALADNLHEQGLKLGIYSSPGPTTCGGYLASWEHELQDVRSWASWGVDYIKYDWCSYGDIAKDQSLDELQKPYHLMHKYLDMADRDIIYSLCQYGMGDVWTWGEDVGGNLWRTTGDITDSWSSMAGIGFSQDKCSPYAKAGKWNDPDMLVVGQVGWGPSLHQSKLSPDEQYTHISLWSLLAAPLLIGCDLTQLDDFTLNLLCNDEVISVNQDPMGQQAIKVKELDGVQIWKKDLQDGSMAVGIFYTGSNTSEDAFIWDNQIKTKQLSLGWDELGIIGNYTVRDLWRQKNLGNFESSFNAQINYHGVVLIKLIKI